jgi:hypothetical protein
MTWMKHGDTGLLADLPDLPYWRAVGWEPTDERPQEIDTLRDPLPPDPGDEPENTEAPAADAPGLSAAQTETSAAAAKSKKVSDRG